MARRVARRVSRMGWIVLMLIGVMMIAVLYSVKTRALEARAYVDQLERELSREQANVQILKAEIAHLESPARLRRLSGDYLGVKLSRSDKVLSWKQTEAALADRKPVPADPILRQESQRTAGR